jgi:hypothetical protein
MKQIVSFILLLLLLSSRVSPVYAKLWVNEFSSSGSTDWVEIYNDSNTDVSLSDYRLRDSSVTNKLDLTGSIQAKGFAVFDWSDRLNNGGDAIRLLKKSDESQIEDTIIYGSNDGSVIAAPAAGQYGARKTDGGSEFAVFSSDTRGTVNSNAPQVPTPTPTPTESPKPTPTTKPSPTPTKAPTPTRTPTPIKSPTTIAGKTTTTAPTQKVTTVSLKGAGTARISPTIDRHMPTAVLAVKTDVTHAAIPSPQPAGNVKTLGVVALNPAIPLIGIGIVVLLGSGGFAYYQYRRNR